MLTIVLGAPGSGKSAVAARLRLMLPDHAVIDWDDFMPAAERLAGRDVRRSPDLWEPYRGLVKAIVVGMGEVPTILLGVCTPDELTTWPAAQWVLLDCEDEERGRRLSNRNSAGVEEATADAADYRGLGLPAIDTTHRSLDEIALEIAEFVPRSPA